MGLLLLILIGLLLYVLLRRDGQHPSGLEAKLKERNREWAEYIASFRAGANKAEKGIINRMLRDLAAKGLPVPEIEAEPADTQPYQSKSLNASKTTAAHALSADDNFQVASQPHQGKPASTPRQQLDNVSLLLYLGAFLFVSAVGLFVAFGGVGGTLRTLAVLLVSVVLYSGGLWIHKNRPKLQQAGLTFVGIGMASAPFVGLAAYNYAFGQSNGPAVWFATSLICLALYTHALITLRKPLISYIFIFTFLSLFESGISVASAPIYYFGWGLAFVGILLSLINRWKGYWPELEESSHISAHIFLPIALFASLLLVSAQGLSQLGVSFLLAAAFYALEAAKSNKDEQELNAVVAQVLAIFGVSSIVYAWHDSWEALTLGLVLLNGLQAIMLLLKGGKSRLWQNFASVLAVSAVVGIFPAFVATSQLLIPSLLLPVIGVIIWLGQRRADAYALTMLSLLALPIIIGQGVLTTRLSAGLQAGFVLLAFVVQIIVYLWGKRQAVTEQWATIARQTFIFSSIAVVGVSLFAPAWVCLLVNLGVVGGFMLLSEYEDRQEFSQVAGILIGIPILRAVNEPGVLLAASLAALALNIALALRHRVELNRWLSAGFWLLLPVGLGAGALGGKWNSLAYAWVYVVIMLGLILSRAVARGVIWVSEKVPLASYTRHASVSYVVGYVSAACLAVLISLGVDNSPLHTSLILLIIGLVTYVISEIIEKRADVLTVLPVVAQALLISVIRPAADIPSLPIFLAGSTVLAVMSYCLLLETASAAAAYQGRVRAVRQGALLAAFVSPASIFFVGQQHWLMPVGLIVAAGLVLYHLRQSTQNNRDWSVVLLTAGILWLLGAWGVDALQAYTHVIVAMFAGLAFWRLSRQEEKMADQYLMAMLATATIPLGLQVLGGQAGGLYGWWLLLEQITFMLLGMSLGKRFVTRWGLYVAVGAVLWQLRNLGWAALTILALFLIGLAVYKLQKSDPKA